MKYRVYLGLRRQLKPVSYNPYTSHYRERAKEYRGKLLVQPKSN